MRRVALSELGSAIAGRALSVTRAQERLRALDTYTESSAPAETQGTVAEAVLRRALLALSTHQAYELAGRILAGQDALAGEGFEAIFQDLAQAGLVVWDPGSGSSRPSPLLRELYQLLDQAVSEAAAAAEEQP